MLHSLKEEIVKGKKWKKESREGKDTYHAISWLELGVSESRLEVLIDAEFHFKTMLTITKKKSKLKKESKKEKF